VDVVVVVVGIVVRMHSPLRGDRSTAFVVVTTTRHNTGTTPGVVVVWVVAVHKSPTTYSSPVHAKAMLRNTCGSAPAPTGLCCGGGGGGWMSCCRAASYSYCCCASFANHCCGDCCLSGDEAVVTSAADCAAAVKMLVVVPVMQLEPWRCCSYGSFAHLAKVLMSFDSESGSFDSSSPESKLLSKERTVSKLAATAVPVSCDLAVSKRKPIGRN
jgi:hypothetical protein